VKDKCKSADSFLLALSAPPLYLSALIKEETSGLPPDTLKEVKLVIQTGDRDEGARTRVIALGI
jgi:hypothetical protein